MEYFSNNYIDLIASIIGLLFLYFEFKASINMWLISILMAVLFIYTFASKHLYASMCIYIYFLGASIYGWIQWRKDRKQKQTSEDIIYRLPLIEVWRVLLFILVAFVLICSLFYFASYNTNMERVGDALSTSLNIVSLWMISKKWAEQWLLLIPANIISGLLLYAQGNLATSIMFYVYAIVSFIGFLYWCRLASISRD